MRKIFVAGIGAAVVLSALVVTSYRGGAERAGPDEEAADRGDATQRERAKALHRRGLDSFARWEEREMFRRMRAAWEADPTYIPPIVDLLGYYHSQARLPSDVRHALDSLAAEDGASIGLCARFILSTRASLDGYELSPAAVGGGDDAHPCALFVRGKVPNAAAPQERLRLASVLWHRHPASPQLADDFLALLAGSGAWDRALAFSKELTSTQRHPLLRARGFAWRVIALHVLGRHDDALAAKNSGYAFARQAEPGIRYAYLDGLRRAADFTRRDRNDPLWPRIDAVTREALEQTFELLHRADLYTGLDIRGSRATVLLDNGRLAESLQDWDELATVIDTFSLQLQAHIYMRRGRTLLKLGELAAAARDLLAARELARQADNVDKALEAEHNLLHLYEAQGRDEEARRAGRAFVKYTRLGGLRPVRMMSYYDFGRFLQRRGEYAAAQRMFEFMLADIDSMNDFHHWAGEYYELIGDLDRAADYYRRSWQSNQFDATRSLAALARIAEATGDHSLAVQYAREHDARMRPNYPEHAPILPGVLARRGRVEEAIGELEGARELARRRRQMAAWARLTLELSRIKLTSGILESAAALADSAASAAEGVAEAAVALRGRALAALARVYLGGTGRDYQLSRLRDAMGQAERFHEPQLEADVVVMLGDALATLSRLEEALAAYGRAADLSDSVAASLSHDAVRAGFRAEQLRISDRALAAVLGSTHPEAPAWYAAWSMRRKSRDIRRIAAPRGATPWRTAAAVIGGIRSLLAADEAVIDFVVVDSAVAALVLTQEGGRIVRLPVGSEALGERVRALHTRVAPQIGSYVDLSRASFDVALARRLYTDLLAPLEPLLAARTRLTIVPDAPLHVVPFDALVISGPDSAPAFAIDRYTLSVATSLGDRAGLGGELPSGPVVAVSGPSTGGSPVAMGAEVEAITRSLPGRGVVRLEGEAATEQAVRRHAGSAAILHFAVHARPNDQQPDFARLTLTPAGDDDGLLHAYEIRELRLPGTLVVLSACESAAGRIVGGEGPLSLSRAFLQAGASSVVGTLWPVGPPTDELMEAFYRALAGGQPAADALRRAKLSFRRRYADPFYWAPFALVSRSL